MVYHLHRTRGGLSDQRFCHGVPAEKEMGGAYAPPISNEARGDYFPFFFAPPFFALEAEPFLAPFFAASFLAGFLAFFVAIDNPPFPCAVARRRNFQTGQ